MDVTDFDLESLIADEALRRAAFPVCEAGIFFGHAGVTALPAAVAQAMVDYVLRSSRQQQEFAEVLRDMRTARRLSAQLIDAHPDEIALLGPTSLGLSLFANGLPWKAGDEIICYAEDYPANVYPWLDLEQRYGVKIRYLRPEQPGAITPELVEAALTGRTRLVALASCHFLTGRRIEVDAIGALLRKRGVLFSLDAIQTIGAFPTSMEHVDFMSADAHKWMLGPMAIGIVYVKKEHFELLRPSLLGAWNVQSPNFIAQPEVRFVETAQRYEPGVLNVAGMYGMMAAHEMFLRVGMDKIAARLLALKVTLVRGLKELDFEIYGVESGDTASSITTFRHPRASMAALYKLLEQAGIVASLRYNRQGTEYIRFSPHFYNTEAELGRAFEVLKSGL